MNRSSSATTSVQAVIATTVTSAPIHSEGRWWPGLNHSIGSGIDAAYRWPWQGNRMDRVLGCTHGEAMNPAVWVQRHARLRPEAAAIADGERVHANWAEFGARAAAVAGGLTASYGLTPGDRVAILMRNRPEYLEALFGAWHAGLVAVPVNARLHRDEIAYILEHSGTAVVLTDEEHADDVGSVPAVVAPGETWERLIGTAHTPLVDRGANDPAWLFYTSG